MNIGNLPPMHGNLLRENDDDIMIYPSELGAQHFQTHPVLQRTMEISPATKNRVLSDWWFQSIPEVWLSFSIIIPNVAGKKTVLETTYDYIWVKRLVPFF